MSHPPTGQQVRISHGEHEVWSVSVVAGLRSYTCAGRPLLDGFEQEAGVDGGRGQSLLPWPNRLAGGRYRFDGAQHQLAITEPASGNAIHGLARWVPWRLVEQAPAGVTWESVISVQPGWPTSLLCRVSHALSDEGLAVSTTATNVGTVPVPYGTGTHPYLRAGTGLVDSWVLRVPARTWYATDDGGIPVAAHDVSGTEQDLRKPTVIGARVLATCFGDLQRDADGRWRVSLTGPDDGPRLVLWADDAFNSGVGVVRLEPGDTHTATWGLSAN